MAYAHFEDHNEILVSPDIGTNPDQLIDLINGSLIHSHLLSLSPLTLEMASTSESLHLQFDPEKDERSQLVARRAIDPHKISSGEIRRRALAVLKETVFTLEQQLRSSESGGSGDDDDESEVQQMVSRYHRLFQSDPINAQSAVLTRNNDASAARPTYGT